MLIDSKKTHFKKKKGSFRWQNSTRWSEVVQRG